MVEGMTKKIEAGWLKWRNIRRVLYGRQIHTKVKGKFDRTPIRQTMLGS